MNLPLIGCVFPFKFNPRYSCVFLKTQDCMMKNHADYFRHWEPLLDILCVLLRSFKKFEETSETRRGKKEATKKMQIQFLKTWCFIEELSREDLRNLLTFLITMQYLKKKLLRVSGKEFTLTFSCISSLGFKRDCLWDDSRHLLHSRVIIPSTDFVASTPLKTFW